MARERVERLREQLAAEEEALSRLMITRETVEEILGETARRQSGRLPRRAG